MCIRDSSAGGRSPVDTANAWWRVVAVDHRRPAQRTCPRSNPPSPPGASKGASDHCLSAVLPRTAARILGRASATFSSHEPRQSHAQALRSPRPPPLCFCARAPALVQLSGMMQSGVRARAHAGRTALRSSCGSSSSPRRASIAPPTLVTRAPTRTCSSQNLSVRNLLLFRVGIAAWWRFSSTGSAGMHAATWRRASRPTAPAASPQTNAPAGAEQRPISLQKSPGRHPVTCRWPSTRPSPHSAVCEHRGTGEARHR